MVLVPLAIMITLRCTRRLQQHLGVKPDPEDHEPTSALGDWYGNLVFMPKSWPLILITNERSLLSVVLRHDADVLAELKQRVIALLRRLDITTEAVEREAFHLQQVHIGKTKNRRVLGSVSAPPGALDPRASGEPGEVPWRVLAELGAA